MRFDFNDFCTLASHYTTSSLSLDCLPGKHPSSLVKYNFTKQNHRTQHTTLFRSLRAPICRKACSASFSLFHINLNTLYCASIQLHDGFHFELAGWLFYFLRVGAPSSQLFLLYFSFFANRSQELNRTCRMLERGAAALWHAKPVRLSPKSYKIATRKSNNKNVSIWLVFFSAVSRSIITPGLKRWGICRVKIKDRILYRRNTAERRRRWQCPEEHDKDLHCFYTTVSTLNWHSLATMLLARLVSRFLDYFFFLLIFIAVNSCRSVTLSSFSHRSRHRTAHKRLLKLS